MKKEIINTLLFWLSYFIFLAVANSLYSFKYWPLFLGGLVGLLMPTIDHLMYVFIFRPIDLTSQRARQFLLNRQYKEFVALMFDTKEERKDLIFHSVLFQLIFTVLTFWVTSSSGNLFARGLVLSFYLYLSIFNLKKIMKKELILDTPDNSRIYFASQVLALFIFGLLI